MLIKTPLMLASVAMLALTACQPNPNYEPNNPNARTRNGAIIGGLIGATVGGSGGNESLSRTLVGGALGAAIGGAIGANLDSQAAELRGSLNSDISVTNTGEYLIVNMPQDLLFAVDSAALQPALTSDIKAVAASLLKYPNSQIEVIGHTDNSGSAAYNQDLSQRRAVSVANVLRDSGVPNGRMRAYGRGEDQPIASNANAGGMARNRRVEIIIRPTS
jgi:outer membrane protein OmpA-like peptidoglycan-associated protein